MKKEFTLEKPKEPIQPDRTNTKKYPRVDGKNFRGDSIKVLSPKFIADNNKYIEDKKQYDKDLELYQQYKIMRFIKNADIKLCLKKYRVVKK